jgi:hypothetical protein
MSYAIYPQNLPGLWAEVVKRPKHNVSVQTHQSGGEVRTSYWSQPLWEWDLSYELLRDGQRDGRAWNELQQIQGFFLAQRGSLNGFGFFDPDDNCRFRTGIGETDGTTTSFTLTRYQGTNGLFGVENIGLLNTNVPFNLYIDSSATPVDASDPIYGYTLNTTTPVNQVLVFNSAPPSGHQLTVDMGYFYWVRFQADSLDFCKFMAQLWELQKVTLQSLRW